MRAETTRQIERLGDQFGGQLSKLSEDMVNVRERLALIEGHFGLAPPPPTDVSDGDDDRDSG